MLKGAIIENSLKDTSILGELQVMRTWRDGGWILHDVLVAEDKAEKLAQYLDNGPWYIHLWQPGADEVTVIFKNRVFRLKYSDKSTWREAVEYGKSIGIPGEQLDFPIG